MNLSQSEIDAIAIRFIELRDNSKKSKKYLDEYKKYQNFCISKLSFLISNKVRKYKKFSNFQDLEQEGFEGLLLALKTYDPNKGSFSWWANKYIGTRVVRAANAHSTIKFPLKISKEVKPHKVNTFPVIIDLNSSPEKDLEIQEFQKIIKNAISKLDSRHQSIINLAFGFNNMNSMAVSSILKKLKISRNQFLKLIEESKDQLLQILASK